MTCSFESDGAQSTSNNAVKISYGTHPCMAIPDVAKTCTASCFGLLPRDPSTTEPQGFLMEPRFQSTKGVRSFLLIASKYQDRPGRVTA